jgi:hypothetical protein
MPTSTKTALVSPGKQLPLPWIRVFLFGWVLSLLALVAGVVGELWLCGQISYPNGYGPFSAAMTTPYLTPLIAVINVWIFSRKWRTIIGVLIASLALPVVYLIGLGAILFLG